MGQQILRFTFFKKRQDASWKITDTRYKLTHLFTYVIYHNKLELKNNKITINCSSIEDYRDKIN